MRYSRNFSDSRTAIDSPRQSFKFSSSNAITAPFGIRARRCFNWLAENFRQGLRRNRLHQPACDVRAGHDRAQHIWNAQQVIRKFEHPSHAEAHILRNISGVSVPQPSAQKKRGFRPLHTRKPLSIRPSPRTMSSEKSRETVAHPSRSPTSGRPRSKYFSPTSAAAGRSQTDAASKPQSCPTRGQPHREWQHLAINRLHPP